MSSDVFWPLVCIALGLLLLVFEVFIPSGGILGVLAGGMLLLGLGLAFSVSTTLGLRFLVAEVLLIPATVFGAFQLWPYTPFGRWILLKPPSTEDLQDDPLTAGRPRLEHLLGQFGRSLTPLRPSGMVDFNGRRIDGLSEDGMIPAGSLVRAVQVRSSQLVVRAVSAAEAQGLLPEDEPASPDDVPS